MPTIKKVFVFLALCSLGVTLTPTTSLAGQCLCKDERSFFSKKTYCFDNINTANECSFLKSATNVTAIDPKTGESSSGPGFDSCEYFAKSCFLLATDNLDGAAYLSKVSTNETPCGSEICKKVTELPCTNNSECSTYLGICKNNFCYLPPAGLTRFQKTPGLTSVAADLQFKKPIFEVRIPGLKFTDIGEAIDAEGYLHIPYIGEFVSLIYKLAMGVGSLVAVVMIITQGLKIVVSGGGELKTEAYGRIGQIVIGLIILWGSYAILYTLNPELVQFRALKVQYIEPDSIDYDKNSEDKQIDAGGSISKTELDGLLTAYASCYNIDWHILKAVAIIESGLNPNDITLKKGHTKAECGQFTCYTSLFQFDSIGCKENIKRGGYPTSLQLDCGLPNSPSLDAEASTAAGAYRISSALHEISGACPNVNIKEAVLLLYSGHNNGPATLSYVLKNGGCTENQQLEWVKKYGPDHPNSRYAKYVTPEMAEAKWRYGYKAVNVLSQMGVNVNNPLVLSKSSSAPTCPKISGKRVLPKTTNS